MSYRDDFDDASLDSTKFGTSVAGDGAVAESGGTVNMTMSANVANGAVTYIKDALVTSGQTYCYTLRHKIDGTVFGNDYLLNLYDGTPACGGAAVVNPNVKWAVAYNSSGLFLGYKDAAGVWQYWTGSGWSTSITYFAINPAYWFTCSIIVKDNKFRICVKSFGDTKAVAETLYVPFASLQAYTTLRLYWGDIYTDYYYTTSMLTDYCEFWNETAIPAYYNGASTTSGADYRVGRAISLDGGDGYFCDPGATLYIVGPAAGESMVKDAHVVDISGTLYMFIRAIRNADPYNGKSRIRYLTSVDDGDTWSDQGYITAPGGVGDWDEKGHHFPVATYDSDTTTWHLYVAGINGSDVSTIGHYYGSDLASLSESANPIISLGSAGAWNDAGLLPCGVSISGATISLYILGLKASTSKWQGGIYTCGDWVTFSEGANPIVARDATKQTTVSGALGAGSVTLTVGDSTIFANGDPIIIGDANYSYPNRVLSKSDSTHITLEYPTSVAYTNPTISGYNWGSVGIEQPNSDIVADAGLGVTFQASTRLLETTAWWDLTGGIWVYNPAKTPPLPLGAHWDGWSAENLKWIHEPVIVSSPSWRSRMGDRDGNKDIFADRSGGKC